MQVAQVQLESGTTQLTCWVENKIKPGDVITLKNADDSEMRWNVISVSQPTDSTTINRGWNNNI